MIGLRAGRLYASLAMFVFISLTANAATYVVTNANDAGAGSLRQAVLDANIGGACPCTIVFDATAFSTPQTIALSSTSMAVSVNNLTIDGFSGGTTGTANTNAFGAADNSAQRVIINGPSTTCCSAFSVTGGFSNFKVSGIVFQDFLTAINVNGSTSTTITGCKFGTNVTGATSGAGIGNSTAISVSATGTIVGGSTPADRNLISGNGIGIDVTAGDVTALGNYIGTTASLSGPLGNSTGVRVASNSNSIGTAAMGNVISGNTTYGVHITSGLSNLVYKNLIGTNGNGTTAIANNVGVYLGTGTPSASFIGGSGLGNVISGNTSHGVMIAGGNGSNSIANNKIGVNATSSGPLANGGSGIYLNNAGTTNGISNNDIGGNTGSGIWIDGANATNISNNNIGQVGATAIGNGFGGIRATAMTGLTLVFQNLIRANTGLGVDVDGAIIGMSIKQNQIGFNSSMGIDLHAATGGIGTSPNDAGDADNGTGNHEQNFPVITLATLNGSTTAATLSLKFNVDSSTVTSTNSLRVEVFEADSLASGEGLRYVGGQCYAGNNLVNSTLSVPSAGFLGGTGNIVATATSYADGACSSINEGTSEFSPVTVATTVGFVTNTNDSGTGSLRQAISDANTATCPSPCSITFNIPNTDSNFVGGVYNIKPLTSFPDITASNTIIDGATQTAFTGNTNAAGPEIVINGALAAAGSRGLGIATFGTGFGQNIEFRNLVVNGFPTQGITLKGSGSFNVTGNKVLACYVGTNASGTAAVPNLGDGILLDTANANQIGSSTQGNLISGNGGNGINQLTGATTSSILGNTIGANLAKTAGIPNGGNGILLGANSTSNTIGGSGTSANTIAFNTQNGVAAQSTATLNGIRFNSIFSNGTLGIDLENDGVTPNDIGDGDLGANGKQNYPILTLRNFNGTNTTISGTINSLASTTFDIDWYSNTTLDGTGFGEGATYENTSTWTTDGVGNVAVSIVLPGDKRASNIVATASRTIGAIRETSEFSASAPNSAPNAFNDTPTTSEDTTLTFDPRLNDSDPNGDAFTITANSAPAPAAGTVSCSTTSCTFTPAANYNGPASFTYTITDSFGASSTATVSITVTAVNDPPVANTDTFNVTEDTPLTQNVRVNDTDVETPTTSLTVIGSTNGTKGTVSCTSIGDCTYTPNLNQTGADSFTYTLSDGANSTVGTVNVNIAAVNDPPVANNDVLVTNEDVIGNVNVLSNDTDPDSTLTVTGSTNGTKGNVSCTALGVCTYSPLLNQNGADSFTYTVTDGTTSVTGTVNVTITPVNDPPVANADTLTTAEDTPATVNVLANDSDVDNTPTSLTVTGSTNGTKGTVVCTTAGICTYTPNLNQIGPDSFTYTVTDPGGATATGTVSVTITGVNDTPIANADTLTTPEDTPGSVNVLTNDVDPDGPSPMTITGSTNGTNGSVGCTTAGICTYAPNLNFNGTDSFTYTVFDGNTSATGTVNVTVTAVNDPPVAINNTATTLPATAVTLNVLANDSDVDGNTFLLTSNTNPANGTVTCTAAGSCTYTPNVGFTGTNTFNYTITDSAGATATATVTITVRSCPDQPTVMVPANGATNVPTSGKLEWDDSGARNYTIFLGTAEQGGCLNPFATTLSPSFIYTGLLPNTTYSWRVEARSPGCPTQISTCRTFTTAAQCASTITPIRPLSGNVASSPVEFEWTPVTGATEYIVFASSGGSTTFAEIGRTALTKLTATILIDGPLSWFVTTTVPNCGTIQSPTVALNLCNRPTAPLATVVGEATSAQNYAVEWEAVANAIRYEIDEADNPGFTGATTTSTDKTSVSFKHDATIARPFYYRVRAFSNCSTVPSLNSTFIRIVILPLPPKDSPNPSGNIPAGSDQVLVQQVFVPGEPNQTLFFTATTDRPWLTVVPSTGVLPPGGVTLDVKADSKNLPNGTFTASLFITVTSPTATTQGGFTASATAPKVVPVSVNLVTPVSPVANKPAPAAEALIIASVGHLDGQNSHWQSDIRVTNVGTTNAKYALTFTPSAGASEQIKSTTINVDAGATTALDDIIRNWFGVGSLGDSANGVLEIRAADSQLFKAVASSRTYNVTSNGTLGQYIPALPFSGFIGKALPNAVPVALSLQQIAQSSAYRTNVGVVEGSGKPASVLMSIFNAAGSKLTEFPIELKAGEQLQLNALLAQKGIALDDARVEVKVTGGEGKVTAYASVVDNFTNDPLLVSGAPTGPLASKYIVPGVADITNSLANWRTDLRIFNGGLTSHNASLLLYPQGGGAPRSAELSLQPGEVRSVNDIVKTLFQSENIGGALHVTTAQPSSLVVTGRTFNQTSTGTYGQFIPAITPDSGAGLNGRTLHILQVEDSTRFRTNLGLAEVSGNPVTVEVQVILPDSKVTPKVVIPLAANEFRQLAVIRELNLGNVYNARLAVRVISGTGSITAYGSVIDMLTQDPTYVPAQ